MLVEQMPERGRVGGLLAVPFLLLIAELTRKGEFIHVSQRARSGLIEPQHRVLEMGLAQRLLLIPRPAQCFPQSACRCGRGAALEVPLLRDRVDARPVPHPGATTAHIDACHRASCQPGPDTNLGRHPPPAAKSWSEGGSRSTGIPGAYPPRRLGRAATGNFRGDAWVVAKSTIMEYRSHSKSTVPITAGSVTDCPFSHLDAERWTMSSARRTSHGAGAATREWATSHR